MSGLLDRMRALSEDAGTLAKQANTPGCYLAAIGLQMFAELIGQVEAIAGTLDMIDDRLIDIAVEVRSPR